MTQPLPPHGESQEENLPLRHRQSRAREAEKIRQDFIKSHRPIIAQEARLAAKELGENKE